MPDPVKQSFGKSLMMAQVGMMPANAKPMKDFPGSSVIEIRDDCDGDTFRTVYTVQFAKAVYVLHVFQKKSKVGISTPQPDLDLIKKRLQDARQDYEANY